MPMIATPAGKVIISSSRGLLPFSDDFGRADGAIGNGWTGATWTISSNKAVNTPTLGSELLTNVEFAVDTTGWSALNSATLTRRDYSSSPNIAPTGGSDNFGIEVASSGNSSSAAKQAPTITAGSWYAISTRAYSPSGNTGVNIAKLDSINPVGSTVVATSSEDAWQTIMLRSQASGATGDIRLRASSTTAGDLGHYDAPSVKALTLSQLFTSKEFGRNDVDVSVKLTLISGTAAGLVLNLDSASSPASFVIAYHDRVRAKLDKYVSGTFTNLLSVTATYSAGAAIRVTKSGSTYKLFYNGSQVGADQTVSDVSVVSNTLAGIFSTYEGNSLDDFSILAN